MKRSLFWIHIIITALLSSYAYAIPFNIFPKAGTVLPTTVIEGQYVTALYTISNNSAKSLKNNYIQYLPPHVKQAAQNSSISDLCGSTFNLAPKGSVGDSCTLQLNIDGAVSAADPNPQHHLFACLPGGKSCAGTYYPLNVSSSLPVTQMVAAGSQDAQQGIVFTRQNQGDNWLFQALSYPDPSIQFSIFTGSSCSNPNCVVAGLYGTDNVTAGVATSHNADLTNWLQQLLKSTAPSQLNGVSCYDASCLAVGTIFLDDASALPVVERSTNAGLNWTQYTLSSPDPLLFPFGSFSADHCSGSLCVAVGSYLTADFSEQSSGVAYSFDGGVTWQQQILPQVHGTFSNQLYGVSCVGLTCIAVGDYMHDTTENDSPGIAITHNGGTTWSNAIIETLPSPYTQGDWQAISCTSAYCVAVGYYSTVSYDGYLGVAVSTDLGQTWIQQALPFPDEPEHITGGLLTGVKCSGANCVAVGNYYTHDRAYPVFVTSSDAGNTWTQQVDINHIDVILSGVG